MTYDEVRELFVHSWKYAGTDQAKAHEIYHDDAMVDFPQSGERFVGKANMRAFREAYPPVELDFQPREIRGGGDVWIAEGRVSYNGGDPIHFVQVLELRGDLVQRETIYFPEPFPAPDWRKPWADDGPAPEAQGDLPAHVLSGKLAT